MGALAVALPVAFAGAASATTLYHGDRIGSGSHNSAGPNDQYCADSTISWTGNLENGKVRISLTSGKSCTVSLTSYFNDSTQWGGSGLQQFIGVDTATVTRKQRTATLTVKSPEAGEPCMGQTDLYFGSTIFDGQTSTGHGPLPDANAGVSTPTDLITSWNGGRTGDNCIAPSTPPPTTTPPVTPPVTTPPSTPATTPPVTPPTTSASPTVSSSIAPVSTTTTPGGTLAHTGGGDTPLYVGGAVVLLALGAGGVFGSRKLAARRSH